MPGRARHALAIALLGAVASASWSHESAADPGAGAPAAAAPKGADPEKVRFAMALCPAAFLKDGSAAPAIGCRMHPPYDAPDRRPDGKLAPHTGDPVEFCAIKAIRHGAFSAKGAREALVVFDACKDGDAWDMGAPGSALLVDESGKTPVARTYLPDVNLGLCATTKRADGRDVLLCQSSFSAPPAGTMTYFVEVDFAAKPIARTVARIFEDGFDCRVLEPTFHVETGLASASVGRVRTADVNGDGIADFVVDVTRARRAASPALDAQVRALCKRDANAGSRALLPAPTGTRLTFVSGGVRFEATPDTAKRLADWEAEAGDLARSLRGAAPATP